MKIGIANKDAIMLTGSKSQPKDICIARLTGTWKAIDIYYKQLITGMVTIRFL
jgi:cobyric acid synthase